MDAAAVAVDLATNLFLFFLSKLDSFAYISILDKVKTR